MNVKVSTAARLPSSRGGALPSGCSQAVDPYTLSGYCVRVLRESASRRPPTSKSDPTGFQKPVGCVGMAGAPVTKTVGGERQPADFCIPFCYFTFSMAIPRALATPSP